MHLVIDVKHGFSESRRNSSRIDHEYFKCIIFYFLQLIDLPYLIHMIVFKFSLELALSEGFTFDFKWLDQDLFNKCVNVSPNLIARSTQF